MPARSRLNAIADARVHGAQTGAQQLLLLVQAAQQGTGGLQKLQIGRMMADRLPQCRQLEIDITG